ncbi:MAG: 50S ribosomal protein L21 [Candidatus Omnitrophota bacterium]
MYAIVQIGSKQYKVSEGDAINVEKLSIEKGKPVTFDKILLLKDKKDVTVGQPYVKEAKITADILGDFKAKKVISYKYRRRKGSSDWKKGHRQQLTRLKIQKIISK